MQTRRLPRAIGEEVCEAMGKRLPKRWAYMYSTPRDIADFRMETAERIAFLTHLFMKRPVGPELGVR